MEWVARALGLFYALGGVAVLHRARINGLLDHAIAKISLKRTPLRDRIEAAWMYVAGTLTLVSGGLLMFLNRWALAAMLLCWVLQSAFLVWAVRTGERPRLSGYVLFTLATGAALWWNGTGLLR